ncbi:MAG: hypothetical protein WA855_11125, partial [Candidatus Acidiferrales bacterium]
MVTLNVFLFALLSAFFSYGMIVAKNRRQVLALVLAGVLAAALANPRPALAQASLVVVIQSVLNVINGSIQTALNSIHSIRNTMDTDYQQAIWPVALIKQQRALVTQMIGQYRNLMQGIFGTNLNSATLPNPVALENVMRDHRTSDFAALTTSF